MTFEEAWPQIKDGKKFKIKFEQDNFWSCWLCYGDIINRDLYSITRAEFELKRDPREFTLGLTNEGIWQEVTMSPSIKSSKYLIKVREVIE